MALPYGDFSQQFNKTAGGANITSGEEPLTLSSRRNQQSAMQNLAMSNMAKKYFLNKLVQQLQVAQEKKANEAGIFDYLGLVPGIGSVVGAFTGGGKKEKFGPGY